MTDTTYTVTVEATQAIAQCEAVEAAARRAIEALQALNALCLGRGQTVGLQKIEIIVDSSNPSQIARMTAEELAKKQEPDGA